MHTRNDYHHIFQRRSTVFFRSVTSWRIKRGHSTPHPPPPLRSNHPAARLTAKLLQQHFNQHWRQLPPGNMVCRRHGSLVARGIDTFVPGRQTDRGVRTLGALKRHFHDLLANIFYNENRHCNTLEGVYFPAVSGSKGPSLEH